MNGPVLIQRHKPVLLAADPMALTSAATALALAQSLANRAASGLAPGVGMLLFGPCGQIGINS